MHALDLIGQFQIMGVIVGEEIRNRCDGIDRTAVKIVERFLARESPVLRIEFQPGPDKIHDVFGIPLVEDRETPVVSEDNGMPTEHGICERMECASGNLLTPVIKQNGSPPQHLLSGFTCEGKQK